MLVREGEVRTGSGRGPGRKRRLWSTDEKRLIVAETRKAGASVSIVARRHDVNANMIFTWRREFDKQERARGAESASFVPALLSADERSVRRSAPTPPEPDTGIGTCARSAGRMEIVLAGGDRIITGKDVCAAALARVVRILQR
ncbi:MAG: transposase [Micropepsaceae bacterium]